MGKASSELSRGAMGRCSSLFNKIEHHYLFVQLLQVIFSDEWSIEVQMAQPRVVRKGREPLSAAHLAQRIKQPQKVMIWGCMRPHGFGRLHIVEGTMNAEQYIHVLDGCLLPQANQWFEGSA